MFFCRHLWNLLQRDLRCEGNQPWIWLTTVQNPRDRNGEDCSQMGISVVGCWNACLTLTCDCLCSCATWCRHPVRGVPSFLVPKTKCISTSSWRNYGTKLRTSHPATTWRRPSTPLIFSLQKVNLCCIETRGWVYRSSYLCYFSTWKPLWRSWKIAVITQIIAII